MRAARPRRVGRQTEPLQHRRPAGERIDGPEQRGRVLLLKLPIPPLDNLGSGDQANEPVAHAGGDR